MKYSPENVTETLPPQTEELLSELRERRNFEPEAYVEAKALKLNNYMVEASLSSCVVAVSGGIDSAVVLGIVAEASKKPDSPIKHIYPLALPVYHDEFTKNQDEATARGRELCQALGLGLIEIDLTSTYDAMKQAVDEASGISGQPWAAGQLVAYLRTPANYYMTSLATQEDGIGIVCGTTNRDEGAYLGYVGKASDGITDVQVISDLHKSEVRALARLLNVPKSIQDAQPTGDMYDGRIDEEVFGTSYDYVELFLMLKSLDPSEAAALEDTLGPPERAALETAKANLEQLHAYNAHKYLVGSPAVHLDILESGVPGGWSYGWSKVGREALRADKFVNSFELSRSTLDALHAEFRNWPNSESRKIDLPKGEAAVIGGVATREILERVMSDVDSHGWQPVGIDGFASNYQEGDPIGSLRATAFSPELADYLWARVAQCLSSPRVFDNDPQVDVEPGSIWRPIGISPLMRFIRYDEGGLLIPHYDAPFIYDAAKMTLKSLVLYTDAVGIEGGATRFLNDDRLDKSIEQRDLSDRQTMATEQDVLRRVDPSIGAALIFDHRLLHDAEPITVVQPGGRKVIVRTDVVYAKC